MKDITIALTDTEMSALNRAALLRGLKPQEFTKIVAMSFALDRDATQAIANFHFKVAQKRNETKR